MNGVFEIVKIQMSEFQNEFRIIKNFFTVSIAVSRLVKVYELNDIKIPFVRVGLNVPFFDVVPFTDVFPMSNLLK